MRVFAKPGDGLGVFDDDTSAMIRGGARPNDPFR